MLPASGLRNADNTLEQGRFAGAVGSDHGDEGASLHCAVEVMDRGVALVAERKIAKAQRCHGRF